MLRFYQFCHKRLTTRIFSYYPRYPDQVSHTVHLDKGKAYYVEAIGKQTEGADSLSVGVQLPSGKKLLPIPRKYLKPVKLPNGKAMCVYAICISSFATLNFRLFVYVLPDSFPLFILKKNSPEF